MAFNIFKSLSSFFKKETIEIDPLSEKADLFLDNGTLDIYYGLIQNGYIPTKKQDSLFITKFNKAIQKKDAVVERMIGEQNYQFTPYNLAAFLNSLDNADEIIEGLRSKPKNIFYYLNDEPYNLRISPVILEHLQQVSKLETFQEYFIDEILFETKKPTIKNILNISGYYNLIEKPYFSMMPVETYMDIISKIEKNTHTTFPKERRFWKFLLNDMKANVKSIYENDLYITMKKDGKIEEEFMSEQAQQKISAIHELYKNISNEKNNHIVKTEVSRLYNERLPEIVKSYTDINPEVRNIKKNIQGKTAEELLIESLDNITILLKDSLEQIHTENISILSVNNRVLNSKVGKV